MAATNHERVGQALHLLKQGLAPFVDREIKETVSSGRVDTALSLGSSEWPSEPIAEWDAAALLKLMVRVWEEVFRIPLGYAERNLVSELRTTRNKWAHQERFSSDDTYRALDSTHRLLLAVSAPESGAVDQMKKELLRIQYSQQVRNDLRKQRGSNIERTGSHELPAWRDVAEPHEDVTSGDFQQAEFAADLWQVHVGEGQIEYQDPAEFFRRTFLTDSLKALLSGAIRRLSGSGGDPVVQLQTNFGGGKTHSMLALYHLVSGVNTAALEGLDDLVVEVGRPVPASVRRVVLVGNKISPGNPSVKEDGTQVRTLWGELAWQLGGKEAFEQVAEDDRHATNPGDVLRQLFNRYAPCLVLIDEWVAYARQLPERSNLPGGNFDTQFTFAQALTEAAKGAKECLLVISLPASDTAGTAHTHAEDIEVGGVRGRDALIRLQNVTGRVDSSWQPASADEGFEIVRRRLFAPLREEAQSRKRDTVARTFVEYYRAAKGAFPSECAERDYERRLTSAYPLHPEIFDRLYSDWSTLPRFQRTRGVLRLMAAVIHALWEEGDRNPLIMPCHIPMSRQDVKSELTRYLPEGWSPVIDADIDGPGSTPTQVEKAESRMGRYSAARRVSRTIYLGSAPRQGSSHPGVNEQRIRLGAAVPGEPSGVFDDALRRLASQSTYLYQEDVRYWYNTRPTVARLAKDRAQSMHNNPHRVMDELQRRLNEDVKSRGDFSRVHVLPTGSFEIPDEMGARLVILGADHLYTRGPGNAAEQAATEYVRSRGNIARVYHNTLVFLAADSGRWQDLDEAICLQLAWQSILDEKDELNLDPQQVKQAQSRCEKAGETVKSQISAAFQWLLVPAKIHADGSLDYEAHRMTGSGSLAERAATKLKGEELLVPILAPSRLRMELDDVPLWKDHVALSKLASDFAQFLYLPRLTSTNVLVEAIKRGLVGQINWIEESFAYADEFDERTGKYKGLTVATDLLLDPAFLTGLLVRPDVAQRHFAADKPEIITEERSSSEGEKVEAEPVKDPQPSKPKRFFGSASTDSARIGTWAARIGDEVMGHLAGIEGAKCTVTLEITVDAPEGISDRVRNTVRENATVLGFKTFVFEDD